MLALREGTRGTVYTNISLLSEVKYRNCYCNVIIRLYYTLITIMLHL